MTDAPLLSVENLRVHFPVRHGLFGRTKGTVKAVDDVSLAIRPGETFGLVGESGCGKTSIGKSILGVVPPSAGRILYRGEDLSTPGAHERCRRSIQLIFQDPYGSLDPRQSAFAMLRETIRAGGDAGDRTAVAGRVEALLQAVELPGAIAQRFPHEMSGGQRQRLGIARALACDPHLIVCDEPVSALDVSIQAQIINLFKRIQRQFGIAYLFVAHDLAVVRHVSHRIGVMYLGRLVEVTDAMSLYQRPLHPYTQALLAAIPLTDYHAERARRRIVLKGEVPSPINRPSGCPFHPRCDRATAVCRDDPPALRPVTAAHSVACHHIA